MRRPSPVNCSLLALTFSAGIDAASLGAELSIQPAIVGQEPSSAAQSPSPDPASTAGTLDQRPARVEFGSEGSRWWTVTGGWSRGLSSDQTSKGDDVNLSGSLSWFIVRNVSVDAELGAWYHSQPGDDAASLNPSMVFRWHFVNTGDWTLYADLGIGVLMATDAVPATGTAFDFTPRAGLGFTRRLGESDTRLVVGLRWAHFSNARIHGDDDNPARDGLMAYGGLTFPF
jgi:hypothetical protein